MFIEFPPTFLCDPEMQIPLPRGSRTESLGARRGCDTHAMTPCKKDVQGALAVGFALLFISTFSLASARVSQKHEIDCVNKKTKMSLVYVFRWQAFETGQSPEKCVGGAGGNPERAADAVENKKRKMMQRQNGVGIDKEWVEIKNGIYSLVAFPVYCQLILMRGIIGEKLIAAAPEASRQLWTCWKMKKDEIGRRTPSISGTSS